MKVGDLVRGAYDKNKYRTGIVLRIAPPALVNGAMRAKCFGTQHL